MRNTALQDVISTETRPDCYLCGRRGEVIYRDLDDRLFGAPGSWTLKQCPGSDCGLIWLDSMPTEKDIGKAYRNYYTHEDGTTQKPKKPGTFKRLKRAFSLARDKGYLALRYDAADGASALGKLAGLLVYLHPMHKTKLDFNAMYLSVRSAAKLLEIGCGSGRQLEFLHQLGWQAEGLDLDPAAVKAASARGLTVHAGSLKEQFFPDGSFDAVVSSHVIEHVHDPVGLLRECGRILKPGANSSSLRQTLPAGATCGSVVTGLHWILRGICIFSTPSPCAMPPSRQASRFANSPQACARQTGYSGQVVISRTPSTTFGAAAIPGS